MGTISALLMLLVLGALYFLPALIAQHRGRDGLVMIALLNLLLGWTLIGWVILLIVAFTGDNATVRWQRSEELRLLRDMASRQAPVPPHLPSQDGVHE